MGDGRRADDLRRSLGLFAVCALAACSSTAPNPGPQPGQAGRAADPQQPPALDAITEADIRRDIFALGGDAMRGREAGTLDEMRATGWVAERAREAGLAPAGEDNTYFQWWSIRRRRLSENSRISIGQSALRLWSDVVALNNLSATLDVPIVYVADSAELSRTDVKGKAVAMPLAPISVQPEAQFTIRGNFQNATANAARQRATLIAQAGGAAAIIVSDAAPSLDRALEATAAVSSRGTYGIDSLVVPPGTLTGGGGGGRAGGRGNAAPQIPSLWVRHDKLDQIRAAGAKLSINIFGETFTYPSGNVIGVVKGTDPRLANEYVLYSGHQDHDGVRYPVNGDSIWNGADDNATVSVALLATARAFVKHPAARPVLFVWHGAEERGLLGSRWYANHPTVPSSQIVAVLNADMIGRNNPDSAALLGAQPPHKNSVALVNAALQANAQLTHFVVDTSWDRPTHPEGWYFRSDHLPYARLGIPAIEFSTNLHPDYHTPRDEPSRIDITKLTKMTRWMYATGWIVASAAQRPDVIPGFKLER